MIRSFCGILYCVINTAKQMLCRYLEEAGQMHHNGGGTFRIRVTGLKVYMDGSRILFRGRLGVVIKPLFGATNDLIIGVLMLCTLDCLKLLQIKKRLLQICLLIPIPETHGSGHGFNICFRGKRSFWRT